jgi:hypothetical protein
MTATAHAAVVVTAIVASIPTIITEAATLSPAAETVPQRATRSDCAASGAAGRQVHSDSGVLKASNRRPVRAAAGWPAASLQLAATSSSSSSRTMSTGATERDRTQALPRTYYMVCVNALLAWVCVLT